MLNEADDKSLKYLFHHQPATKSLIELKNRNASLRHEPFLSKTAEILLEHSISANINISPTFSMLKVNNILGFLGK